MSVHDSDVFSLRSLLQDQQSSVTSVRDSIEYAVPDKKGCHVHIFDQTGGGDDDHAIDTNRFALLSERSSRLPNGLAALLAHRTKAQTRWINFTGWSAPLVAHLSKQFLDNHGCLDFHNVGGHVIGGPIKCQDGSHFVWIQNSIWYNDHESNAWSSVQQCGFRMVIKLPTPQSAGTVITTFTGKQELVERVSQSLTVDLLDIHSMGADAMTCVWVLAESIMRGIITQLGRSFHNFDLLDRINTTLDIDQLPYMLNQANELARIDRYTSGLVEILGFFGAVRDFQQSQKSNSPAQAGPQKCYSRITERSNLESILAKQQITHVQQLCRTYIKQYESHTQMMLSYSSARMAEKLERGSKAGEKIAAVGIVLAAISVLTSPLAVVTGYFGMNVQSLVNDGKSTLFDFWSIALPVFAFSLAALGVMFSRLVLSTNSPMSSTKAWKVS